MEKELLQIIQKDFSSYKEKIEVVLDEYEYRLKRYKVNYALSIYAATGSWDIENVKNKVRKTDTVIELEEKIFAVVFDFVNDEYGIKACENLLSKIEPKMFGKKIYISVLNSKEQKNNDDLIRKVFDLLTFEVKNELCNVPLDAVPLDRDFF